MTEKENKGGRPYSDRIEYFQHRKPNQEEDILIFKHGAQGYSLYNMLRELALDKGYYVDLTDATKKLLCAKLNIDPEGFGEILASMLDGLFDRQKYDEYGILTNVDMQRHFLFVKGKNRQIHMTLEYLLINNDCFYSEYPKLIPKLIFYSLDGAANTLVIDGVPVYSDENPVYSDENPVYSDEYSHSIEENRKDSKEYPYDSKVLPNPETQPETPSCGEIVNGKRIPSYDEVLRFQKEHGGENASIFLEYYAKALRNAQSDEEIKKLDDWQTVFRKYSKDHHRPCND